VLLPNNVDVVAMLLEEFIEYIFILFGGGYATVTLIGGMKKIPVKNALIDVDDEWLQ
jgi:hypothetical protein